MTTQFKQWFLDGERISLAEFLVANYDMLTLAERIALRQMKPGASMTFGGGACPEATLECRVGQSWCDICDRDFDTECTPDGQWLTVCFECAEEHRADIAEQARLPYVIGADS